MVFNEAHGMKSMLNERESTHLFFAELSDGSTEPEARYDVVGRFEAVESKIDTSIDCSCVRQARPCG